ncbi:MAG: AEC family transporter [Oligoflexia bacterium]|nr:AEC family transporter [Oligoflexia bacterium]
MGGLILVFVCMAIGILIRYYGIFPDSASTVLNRFVIYVSLPALTILHLHHLGRGSELGISPVLPALMAWIILIAAIPLFIVLSKILGWDKKTTGAVILMAGLGNTSFVGFALLEAFYGTKALPIAILTDSPGTFLATATLGIALAAYYAGRDFSWRKTALKVLAFPPFLTLFIALGLRAIDFPNAVNLTLERLGATLVPLALTSVGMELRISPAIMRRYGLALVSALGFKLLLAPAIIFIIYFKLLALQGLPAEVIVLESAMAPMITAGIIAAEYDLRGEFASLMIGIGIPLSLISVPLIRYFLRFNV